MRIEYRDVCACSESFLGPTAQSPSARGVTEPPGVGTGPGPLQHAVTAGQVCRELQGEVVQARPPVSQREGCGALKLRVNHNHRTRQFGHWKLSVSFEKVFYGLKSILYEYKQKVDLRTSDYERIFLLTVSVTVRRLRSRHSWLGSPPCSPGHTEKRN